MKAFALISLLFTALSVHSQPNCNAYTGECRKACEVFNQSERLNQGSLRAHVLFDSAIQLCPTFAFAWHEKSVGYLKNGEFLQWRKYMDEAVKLSPNIFLSNRGWCRFKFLHDYEGALADLQENKRINKNNNAWSNDGDYDLTVVMALCYRELGETEKALALFKEYFYEKEVVKSTGLGTGAYDYLHYGVTLMKAGKKNEAAAAFKKQISVYEQFPDTYYYLALLLPKSDPGYQSNLLTALSYMEAGYSRKDPYCEALDEVYPSDLKKALNNK